MKVLEFVWRFVKAFMTAMWELAVISLNVPITIKKGFESIWTVIGLICFQPTIIGLTAVVLQPLFNYLISDTSTPLIVDCIVLVALASFVITFINSAIELLFTLTEHKPTYSNIQELQACGNGYVLIIVSLLALYVAAFPVDQYSELQNMALLVIGTLYFLSTICSDIYRKLVYEKGLVGELSDRIKEIMNNG